MPLFLITGLPGSGKPTICEELKSRGYAAYDGGTDHLAQWYNDETGFPFEEEQYIEHTADFFATYSRNITQETVKGLAAENDNPVFLCGDAENEADLQHLFKKMFALILNEDNRNRRLAQRTNNQWGKRAIERAYSERFGQKWEKNVESSDYVLLDAAKPTKVLADEIIGMVTV